MVIDAGIWGPRNILFLDLGAGYVEHFHIVKIYPAVYLWLVYISTS